MDEDLELLAQYKTEVEKRLKKMPPVSVELSPLQSLATVVVIHTNFLKFCYRYSL